MTIFQSLRKLLGDREDRAGRYHRMADRTAAKRGRRVEAADRLRDYSAHLLSLQRRANDATRELHHAAVHARSWLYELDNFMRGDDDDGDMERMVDMLEHMRLNVLPRLRDAIKPFDEPEPEPKPAPAPEPASHPYYAAKAPKAKTA